MLTITLRVCPFCESPDWVTRVVHQSAVFVIQCKHCRAQGPPRPDHNEAAAAWGVRIVNDCDTIHDREEEQDS